MICHHQSYNLLYEYQLFISKAFSRLWDEKNLMNLKFKNYKNWCKEIIDIHPPAVVTPAATATASTNSGEKYFKQKFEQISFPPNIPDLTFLFQVHWGPSWTPCSVDNHRFWGEFAAFFNLRPSDDQSSLRVQPKGRLEIFWTGSLEAWNEWTQRLWQPLSALDRGPVYLKNLVFLRNCKAFEPTRFVIRHQLTRYSQWK